MEKQIRFLVESYYDIQKLRIETFNRIVSYVKEQSSYASHEKVEPQQSHASHLNSETQLKTASQGKSGIQNRSASRKEGATHIDTASLGDDEALSLFAGILKPSEIAKLIIRGKHEVPEEIKLLVWYHDSLFKTEKELAKQLDMWSKDHPLRIHFLDKIQGIGGVLASGIIAWLHPISRFPNISKLWKYCGLAPGQKRIRGKRCGYNPKLKALMWKIATSFEKQKPEKSYYRRIYGWKKLYYMERPDLKQAIENGEKGVKLHIRLMTLRYVAKRFLADLWVQWRKLEGLPITKPYPHAILGHEEYEEWKPDK